MPCHRKCQTVTRHFRMTHPKFLSILILLVLTSSVSASCQITKTITKPDTKSEDLAKYRKVFWDNLPEADGFVNDYENLFTDREEIILDSLIKIFEKRSTIQIAVVTIDTILTSSDRIDALTLRLARHWGVGQKYKNNGVLIAISRGYRKMRIQNGYGIEKVLTDKETKQIIDKVFIPKFRDANYFEGTFNGLLELMNILEQRYK